MRTKQSYILLVLLFLCCPAQANTKGELPVEHNNAENAVEYELYIHPKLMGTENLPVVVCTGGVPLQDGVYATSSTDECMNNEWKKFAKKHEVAILGLGFKLIESDWEVRQSYQFPYHWSGDALDAVLRLIAETYPIDPDKLMLYGVSGGAQFSARYALLNPEKVIAVASHAAGSYEPPLKFIPTKFMLTVGELDNDEVVRREIAEEFHAALQLFDISSRLEIIPGIAHIQTPQQDKMSRAFFAEALKVGDTDFKGTDRPYSLAIGSQRSDVLDIIESHKVYTHRSGGGHRFKTFSYGPDHDQLLTLHFVDDALFNWGLNARSEVVDEYLTEFLSGGILRSYPKTFKAIRNALIKLPQQPFLKVIDRERPVIFLDVTTGGIARYANAIDFYFREDDPPALSRGFYLIKLGRDLEQANSVEAIEGIIFHELTHHILDHLRGPVNCDTEREANRLVRDWGFEAELRQASDQFGAKSPEDSPCYEKKS